MSIVMRVLRGFAAIEILITVMAGNVHAHEDLFVTLSQPDQAEPFAVFHCTEFKLCEGEAVFEKNGMKLPLHFLMEAFPGGVSFNSIDCSAIHWHFSLLNDDGSGARFPPGSSTGTMVLDEFGGVINPVVRKPLGGEVGKIVIGLFGKAQK